MKTTTIRTDKTITNYELRITNCLSVNPQSAIRNPHSEKGAALVALMALMTIMALFMLAAAPSLLMDVQRAKEAEAIGRGEEIADAIRIYVQMRGQLPQRMEDLTEGISRPGSTKKRMILRQSAAIDPLSSTGEWKMIQSSEIKTINEFQRKLVNYTGSNTFSNPPSPNGIFDRIAGQVISAINTETEEDIEPPGGEDTTQNVDGPFVAVMSRSQRKSVISYYGIERHDRWLFTPLFRGTGSQGGFPGVPPQIPSRPGP
jgi:type II secretory pathway pseudopilin PulG